VQFIVLSRSLPNADRTGLAEEEYRLVDELHASGFFEQIYLRRDRHGAISIIEAESEEMVRERLAKLPFAVHGCVEIEQVLAVTERW
jgi:muconolactone delta-isomerase